MSRLPVPGQDQNTWGTILNDFLSQSLDSGGSLKTGALTAAGTEFEANKGVASGYAPLNSLAVVPAANLGTGAASTTTFLAGDNTWQTINQAPSSTGDYMGLRGTTQVFTNNSSALYQFGSITAQRGSSTSWSISTPSTITINETGVYSVNTTLFWQDTGVGGLLDAQLFTSCGFMTQENRAAFANGTASTQNISGTFYLQQGQNVLLELLQATGVDVTPNVWLLITRVS